MGDPVSIDLKALMLANVETNEMSANVMYGVPATYPDLTMAVTHFSTSWYFSNTSWEGFLAPLNITLACELKREQCQEFNYL